MKKAFTDVLEWRVRVDGTEVIPGTPSLPEGEPALDLMMALIDEEMGEVLTAAESGNVPEFADGLADLIWVCMDAAARCGIDLPAVWEEVRRTNLAKIKDRIVRREDGKVMKPAGWKPPDVARVLARQKPLVIEYDRDICDWV